MSVDVKLDLDAAFNKLGEVAAKYGPQAVDVAAEVVRVNAIGTIVVGLACAVLLGLCIFFFRWGLKKNQDNYYDDYMPVLVSSSCGIILFGIAAALHLLNIWAWVALFNPKLALARDIWVKLTTVVT